MKETTRATPKDRDRAAFERWMVEDAKVIDGSQDPYPSGLESDWWKVWQAALRYAEASAARYRGALAAAELALFANAQSWEVEGYMDNAEVAHRQSADARRARTAAGGDR